MTPFEEFAMDHSQHKHCLMCEGCILSQEVQEFSFVWCLGCCKTAEGSDAELIDTLANWRRPDARKLNI